jgi:hypothetical protein
VVHAGTDQVGQTIAQMLKEAIAKSSVLKLSQSRRQGLRLVIVSLDTSNTSDSSQATSAYALMWQFKDADQPYPRLLDSAVAQCSAPSAARCADEAFEDTQRVIAKALKGDRSRLLVSQPSG